MPAGNLLVSIGYKKTALYAIVVGLIGLALQWLSGLVGTETGVFSIGDDVVTLNFIIYFIAVLQTQYHRIRYLNAAHSHAASASACSTPL